MLVPAYVNFIINLSGFGDICYPALICLGNTGSADGITTPPPPSTPPPTISGPWTPPSPPPVLEFPPSPVEVTSSAVNDNDMDEHHVSFNMRNLPEDTSPFAKSFDSETFNLSTAS